MDDLTIILEKEADVGIARAEARTVAKAMGFDDLAIAQIALGVSEICHNAIRHAKGGKAIISTLNQNKILRIEVKDNGPGIDDLHQVMQEGYSTIPTSLGIGLEVAQKSMDKFEITTTKEKGTSIVLEKYLPIPATTLEFGIVSLPDEHYTYNGDEYLIHSFEGDKVLLAVIDGLGQGYTAHQMAISVKKIIKQYFNLPLIDLIQRCDKHLRTTYKGDGGVAMSLALIESQQLTYLGIGDTHAYLQQGTHFRTLSNIDGRVGGQQLRSLTTHSYPLTAGDIFILCTDGINTHVSLDKVNRVFSAQNMANTLFNQFHRTYGDVTVLVLKYQPNYE